MTRTKYSFYFCCDTTYCIVIYSTTYSQEMEYEKRIKKILLFFKAAENQKYGKCRHVDMGRKGDRRLWRFTKRFTMEILIQDFFYRHL